MTPFQDYAHTRWLEDFPDWASLREDINGGGEPFDPASGDLIEVRYQLPSPANPDNILCVVFTPEDVLTWFAVPGSHEHYDPDLYGGPDFKGDRSEFWPDAYEDALAEYIRPVIEDRMFAVYYGDGSILVFNVEEFMMLNQIEYCQYESWSQTRKELRLSS